MNIEIRRAPEAAVLVKVAHKERQVGRSSEVVHAHLKDRRVAVDADKEINAVICVVVALYRSLAVPFPMVRAVAGRDIVLLDRVWIKPAD